jgi:hypothetical protein
MLDTIYPAVVPGPLRPSRILTPKVYRTAMVRNAM